MLCLKTVHGRRQTKRARPDLESHRQPFPDPQVRPETADHHRGTHAVRFRQVPDRRRTREAHRWRRQDRHRQELFVRPGREQSSRSARGRV